MRRCGRVQGWGKVYHPFHNIVLLNGAPTVGIFNCRTDKLPYLGILYRTINQQLEILYGHQVSQIFSRNLVVNSVQKTCTRHFLGYLHGDQADTIEFYRILRAGLRMIVNSVRTPGVANI